MRLVAAVLTTVVACATCGPALAQDAPGAPSSTPATATPPVAPAPAAAPNARLRLSVQRPRTVLAGDAIRVHGLLTPYAAGQRVTVRVYRGARKVGVKVLAVRRSRSGHSGIFTTQVHAPRRAGRIAVQASHRASRRLGTAVARRVRLRVLALRAGPGSRGPVVRVLQQRLSALGYVVGRRGSYDARTARAVLAFRKVTGLARTQLADSSVFARLAAGAGRFRVRHPEHGKHVEADLGHQVLALIRPGGKVERIYPLSSGKPSTPTVLGSFRFYSKTPGTNAKGMFFSNYFIRGYAVHGYPDVPTYPASHGCLRVPNAEAVSIFNWISLGDPIDVYR